MSTPALNLDDFDTSVPASQDLFQHVNGRWLATAEIPADRSSWGAFDKLREDSELAVREIIDGLTATEDPTSETSKIANLYASFMNEDRVNELGTEPLEAHLARIDAIDSVPALARHWGWSVRHGVTPLADMGNDADPGDPQRYLMFVGQSGIGLPDEEYYRLDAHAEIRAQYRDHIKRMLTLAHVPDAAQQADAVVDLESRIAACHWDKVRTRDIVQMYYPQTWEAFVADSPTLAWDAFLEGAELPAQAVSEVVNSQRTFLSDVAALVTDENLPSWRSWARWHLVTSLAPYLTTEMSEAQFDFYGRTMRGIPQQRKRWKRGVQLTEAVLGEAVGKIYVDRHFPPATKVAADALVENLLEAYRRSITDLEWMGTTTREEALTKLANFRPKIGYPLKWRDYSKLTIDPDDLVANVMRADSFVFDHAIEQLSGPVDRDEWFMFPQTVNAYYHPLRNEIVFPAAILQPPFFNVDADEAVNYGGIGAVIGHEIGHGFDDQGSTCDGEGRLRNWWTDADREAFEARTRALIGQYNELSPSVASDVRVNGELTLGENIGDLGGLSIAHLAWRISQEIDQAEATTGTSASTADDQPEDQPAHAQPAADQALIDGYTGAQRLFLSWGAVWQDLSRPEAMRERVATDPHSPDEFRCNQVARNIDAFHEAFGTQPGQGMWLEPTERVKIW